MKLSFFISLGNHIDNYIILKCIATKVKNSLVQIKEPDLNEPLQQTSSDLVYFIFDSKQEQTQIE